MAKEQYYSIFVRDLVLVGLIGIHPHERIKPQRICVNIELEALDNGREAQDDIQNVVSYEDIVNGVKRIFHQRHVGLVETLAEDVAAFCLEDRRVHAVKVRIEKPDVIAETAAVGIEIRRFRR